MITLISISDSDKHFITAIQEYEKRLGNFVKHELIKPSKNGNQQQIIDSDTTNLIKILEKKNTPQSTYLLSKEGLLLDTLGFTKLIQSHNHMTFIIGGPYGLDEDRLKPYIRNCVAFGKITLPHGLAKLVLFEQIYRASTIIQGKEYHY